ncbi:MAG TPA: hypothetical protein VKX35_11490 [Fermentimonas sp.]|nr:hypothetical protein [Fermentimonas sp.]
MRTLIRLSSILLIIASYSCNFGTKASVDADKEESNEDRVNMRTNWKDRIVDPTTNSEKAINLWLDLERYATCYIEKDVRGFIDMTIPTIVECVGDSAMISSTESYLNTDRDYDFITIKHQLEEGVFYTTENAIIASVMETREFGRINSIQTNSYSLQDEIVALSINNGVSWQFAKLPHIEHIGVEFIFPNDDSDEILKFLGEDMNGKRMTTKSITFHKR